MEKLIKIIADANPVYSTLRLKAVKYMPGKRVCNIFFLYPADAKYPENFQKEIENIVKKALGFDLFYYFHFHKISVIENFVVQTAAALIKRLGGQEVLPPDIEYSCADGKHKVKIKVNSLFYDFIMRRGIDKTIADGLDDSFCAPFEVEICPDNKPLDLPQELPPGASVTVAEEDFTNRRVIVPLDIEKIVGKEISEPAVYIKDLSRYENATICGKVKSWQKLTYIKRNGENGENGGVEKVYYKFILEDFTADVECVYFATKSTPKALDEIKEGDSLIISGAVKPPAFKEGRISVVARSISFCEIPVGLTEVIYKKSAPKEYTRVFPTPVVVYEQAAMFAPSYLPDEVVSQTYVVFDLETTGLYPSTDKITEIGAVKISGGKITEQWTTLVNPQRKLSLDNTMLTGITDDMLKDAPLFEEVVGDFYKFCEGAILVAHNAKFDYSFINAYSDTTHYYFENTCLDTIELAVKKLPRLKDYKLATLAKHFNIENPSAHRALYDALTTAQIFLELSRLPAKAG